MSAPQAAIPPSQARYRRIALIALVFLYLIVITGATVRLTGSGLGCPDWPSCHGSRPVPALKSHELIEFGNRTIALPTLVMALWAMIAAFRLKPRRRDLRIGSSLPVLGVFMQIGLGGITVMFDLHPLLVSAHFLLSMLILACATFAWQASGSALPVRRRAITNWTLGAALLPIAATVITAGVLTTAAGPHSGAAPESPIARLAQGHVFITLHARGAYVFAVVVIALTLLARRTRAGARDLGLLTGLIALQITLGEIQYRNGLPWGVVLAHVATACLIWVTTCRIAFAAAFTMEERAALPHLPTRTSTPEEALT